MAEPKSAGLWANSVSGGAGCYTGVEPNPCCEPLSTLVPKYAYFYAYSSNSYFLYSELQSSLVSQLVPVTLGSPRYGQGPLGPADIRSATRLPSQPPGPPGVPLMIQG